MKAWLGALFLFGAGLPLVTRAADAAADVRASAASAPLQCWLRTGTGSVLVGEAFDVTLTCSVLETPALAAIPDFASLEPATIQFAPFEVTGGVRHADVVAGDRRFVQFRYDVRLIGDAWFGQDVALPAVTLKYTLATAAGGGAAREGRERSYRLPTLPVRVLSLVPPVADGLREPPGASFAQIDARRGRARAAAVAATVLAAFGAAFVFLAGAALLRRPTRRGPALPRLLPPAAMFDSGRRAWRDAKGAAGASGWTPEIAAQALAGLRVAAAVAAACPVRQAIVEPGEATLDGQIATRWGLLRPRRVLLSAATTPDVLERRGAGSGAGPREAADLALLGHAIRRLSHGAYGRDVGTTGGEPLDEPGIDAALARCRVRLMAPLRALVALRHAALRWRLAWVT